MFVILNFKQNNIMKKTLLSVAFMLATVVGVNAQTTLSQTNNQFPDDGGVACVQQGVGMGAASYFRAYTLTSNFTVGSVKFGIGSVVGPGTQLTAKLHTSASAFPGSYPAGLTEVGSGTLSVTSADDLSLVSIPVSGTFTSGTIVVVEITYSSTLPADGGNGTLLYPGIVSAATANGYILAAGCGINTPTTFAGIGFPNNHIIIDLVEGTAGTEDFANAKFSVYPNPANDVINIAYADAIDAVTITDLNGRVVKQVVLGVNEGQINISDLSQGVYILNATSNGKSITEKIVKK